MSAMGATPSTIDTEVSWTRFIVWVFGNPAPTTESLQEAARAWNRLTYDADRSLPGGIAFQQFNAEGIMVRDGWIMHVHDDGTVYLSPSLTVTP